MEVKEEISEELVDEPVTVTSAEEFVKLESNFIENDTISKENIIKKETPEKVSSIYDSSVYDPPFECEMCGKLFYKKHVLEGHLRKHCGLKVNIKFKHFTRKQFRLLF